MSAIHSGGIHGGIAFLHNSLANPELGKVIRSLYLEIGLRYARMNYRNARQMIQKGFGFNQAWTDFIKAYLEKYLIEKITYDVATTVRDYLLKVLQDGLAAGLSIDEMVNQLRNLPFYEWKAAQIVRTEVGRAANVGTKAQSETWPYEQMKEWISAEDNRVRGTNPKDHASHVALDGVRINADDLFKDPRNGDLLDHPGDPRASAESTINCRCSIAYLTKRDSNGNPIPKRQSTFVSYPNQNTQRQIVTI